MTNIEKARKKHHKKENPPLCTCTTETLHTYGYAADANDNCKMCGKKATLPGAGWKRCLKLPAEAFDFMMVGLHNSGGQQFETNEINEDGTYNWCEFNDICYVRGDK